MKQDKEAISNVITRMLENPTEEGIYPTSTAFIALEHYIENQRLQAIGWMHTKACDLLDTGSDPRTIEVRLINEQAVKDLEDRLEFISV
ncbi:MAG: hypothetical protein GY774_04855 [Planctomycetes bacterium]|nr:hypothetical protein [Planctomycetota bacterium]